MKTVNEWFDDYGVSHQNPTNKLIHYICVPLITLSVIGLFWSIPVHHFFPFAHLPTNQLDRISWLNVGTVFMLLALVFYLRLSPILAAGMIVESLAMLGLVYYIDAYTNVPVWLFSTLIFVVAWIFQFIGHNIEGAKPSFFKDMQFLLIGPLWILGFLYRKAGIKY
jgi:uncharacterized membrane protein YGL010W